MVKAEAVEVAVVAGEEAEEEAREMMTQIRIGQRL